MSASTPLVSTYTFPAHDFGAGTGTEAFRAPDNYTRGKLIDVGITGITEVFACDATTAKVRVGTAADADAYAELAIADTTAVGDQFNTQDDTDAIIAADLDDTQIEVTYVACVDSGTETGIATPFVIVAWY